eukprot:4326056-Pyramimonas_sp.AAC.1
MLKVQKALPCQEEKMEADPSMQPELRSLLQKVANDKREVMLALANGVMICKNTTICWWNGGNILQSFLQMAHGRHQISNLVVGVLDDETWKYMDEHFPRVHKFRPKVRRLSQISKESPRSQSRRVSSYLTNS